jgi:hypothetical protein
MKENKLSIATVLALIMVVISLVFIIYNMEPVDYVELVENISEEEMEDINSVRRQAFDYAVSCSDVDLPITFEDITWRIQPSRMIRFSDDRQYLDLVGWYDTSNDIIWIAYPYRKVHWVNSHEILHKLGFIGHGTIFANCGLLVEQQD